MKLRNKKTGEIGQIGYVATNDGAIIVEDISGSEYPFSVISNYKTLTKLNEDWEDYKPAGPLIKDEKIRKAVKAWAEAVGTECVEITHSRSHFIRFMSYLADDDELCMSREIGQIFDEKLYTIAELCGEEEEYERVHGHD